MQNVEKKTQVFEAVAWMRVAKGHLAEDTRLFKGWVAISDNVSANESKAMCSQYFPVPLLLLTAKEKKVAHKTIFIGAKGLPCYIFSCYVTAQIIISDIHNQVASYTLKC